ncbi:hypothetical protein EV122DRAFT_202176 [Schizophyllum commune]
MSRAASSATFAPRSEPRCHSNRPLCTPNCVRTTRTRRGRLGASICKGDIRKTEISLVAPFHKFMDEASLADRMRRSRAPSTLRSRSSVAPSQSPSRLASPSCVSSTSGGKVRPCIVLQEKDGIATVCTMGTFEKAHIQILHPSLREHIAVMYSRKCMWQDGWIGESGARHLHSSPEFYQAEGCIQYIVPIMHDIEVDAVGERWSIHRKHSGDGDGDAIEGYYLDSDNMNDLQRHILKTRRDLKEQFASRRNRNHFRHVLRKKKKVSCFQLNINASVRTFDSYAPSIDSVLSQAEATPVTQNIRQACEESSNWRSAIKRISTTLSMTSTSSRSTTSKRHFEYDDECPRTPKAAKQELDASSMRSKGSTRSIPFKRSSKANTPLPPVTSRNKHEALECQ